MSYKFTSKKTKVSRLLSMPLVTDEGNLSFAETERHIPFQVKRFYIIYDVEKDAVRGKHAHKRTDQLLFCLKGSVTVTLDNGQTRETVKLSKPNQGILLNRHIWHEMKDFTKDTILLVAASEYYVEADYIRNYDQFLRYVNQLRKNFFSFPLEMPIVKLLHGYMAKTIK